MNIFFFIKNYEVLVMNIDKTLIATLGGVIIGVYGLYLGNETIAAAALTLIAGILVPSPVAIQNGNS